MPLWIIKPSSLFELSFHSMTKFPKVSGSTLTSEGGSIEDMGVNIIL